VEKEEAMKVCPICHSRAFDDAAVCFGCMHRFGEKPAQVLPAPEPQEGDVRMVPVHSADLPAFLIKLTPPQLGDARSWTCSVELVGS